MTTETRYIVRSERDKRGRACNSIETARWLAEDWKREGTRGVVVYEQTVTTRPLFTV